MSRRFSRPIGESRSTPGEFANVEIPVTTISDSDGFLFEFVNDLIQVNVLWKNIHKQISGTNRKEARPLVRTPKKDGFNGVNCINIAGDARDTGLIGVDGPNEMPVRFAFEPSTVDHMKFFAWF